MTTPRQQLVLLAKSTVADCKAKHADFTYAEVRPMVLTKKYPWKGDCSTYVTWLYWMCGLPDPNGAYHYNGWGNTSTLFAHGQKIALADVEPGDVVVYAADKPLMYQHTAIVVEAGKDPLTVSMGMQGDPSFVRVSQDGRKPFFVRFLPSENAKKVTPTIAPSKPAAKPNTNAPKPAAPKTK
jgi:hypothetical protein